MFEQFTDHARSVLDLEGMEARPPGRGACLFGIGGRRACIGKSMCGCSVRVRWGVTS